MSIIWKHGHVTQMSQPAEKTSDPGVTTAHWLTNTAIVIHAGHGLLGIHVIGQTIICKISGKIVLLLLNIPFSFSIGIIHHSLVVQYINFHRNQMKTVWNNYKFWRGCFWLQSLHEMNGLSVNSSCIGFGARWCFCCRIFPFHFP